MASFKTRYPGAWKPEDLPRLDKEPKAECPHCGTVYGARWAWEGSETKGEWVLRTGADDMFGHGDVIGHAAFCEKYQEQLRTKPAAKGGAR